MGKFIALSMMAFSMVLLNIGCARLETKHVIEVKPMHITIDVNLKVDKELDNFFDDIDEQDESMDEKTAK